MLKNIPRKKFHHYEFSFQPYGQVFDDNFLDLSPQLHMYLRMPIAWPCVRAGLWRTGQSPRPPCCPWTRGSATPTSPHQHPFTHFPSVSTSINSLNIWWPMPLFLIYFCLHGCGVTVGTLLCLRFALWMDLKGLSYEIDFENVDENW